MRNFLLCRSEGSAKVLLADSTGFLSHPPPPWLSGPSHGRTPRTPTGSARAWMVHSERTQRVLARGRGARTGSARPGSGPPGPRPDRLDPPLTTLPHSSDTRTMTKGPGPRHRQVSSLCAQSRLQTHCPHMHSPQHGQDRPYHGSWRAALTATGPGPLTGSAPNTRPCGVQSILILPLCKERA